MSEIKLFIDKEEPMEELLSDNNSVFLSASNLEGVVKSSCLGLNVRTYAKFA